MKEITLRFLKVIYVLLLLFGLWVGWKIWINNTPRNKQEYSFHVTCENGKTFDPTSKPIPYVNKRGVMGQIVPEDLENKDVVKGIKSQCKYGTVYNVGVGVPLEDVNYKLTYDNKTLVIVSFSDQIERTILVLAVYYLILEIVRRTFLYTFFGMNFFTLKKGPKEKDKNG